MSVDDVGPLSIAGHMFAVKERAGGLLYLRIALKGSTISELALRLTGLDGVRVTKGPDGVGRCYIAHCAGFKMVLSADEADDAALALVSATPDGVAPVPASELSGTLAGLMTKSSDPVRPGAAPSAFPTGRAALAPGKPLSRKAPLMRKTPLRRSGKKRPR